MHMDAKHASRGAGQHLQSDHYIHFFALRHGINILFRRHLGVPVHPERMLRLVHEPLLAPSVHRLVLATANLVVQRLRVALARVGLCAARDLVGAASDGLLGLVKGGFGGVGSLGWLVESTSRK
jgi:hypothetical protein